ncbi:glucoamylase [Amylostereum chailletii]|nr:glucoamylase [Amylostereum chailletii]
MHLLSLLSLAVSFADTAFASDDISSYISKMIPIARKGAIQNMGEAIGAAVSSLPPGAIAVAHVPSITDPTMRKGYSYSYIRDANMVQHMWIRHFAGGLDETLRPALDDSVHANVRQQHVSSPSGNLFTGGLAEPKLLLDLSPELGSMPRPENDGPPLRSTFLMDYGFWLLDHNNGTWVAYWLWPIIHIDLMWTALHWNESSFELWETVFTSSYWTASVQLHALHEGAQLAKAIGREADVPMIESQAAAVLAFMQSFWNADEGYMTANTQPGRNVDTAPIYASNFNYDQAAGCDPITFQPCSDKALSSLKVTVDRFKKLYPISQDIPNDQAGPSGMYYEDTYNGGQPWYFAVFGCAEQLYNALNTWDSLGSLTITNTSLAFFRTFQPGVLPGTYHKVGLGMVSYLHLTQAIRVYADGFVALCAKYTPESGVLYEGFNKTDGTPVGAPGLSWSYAAALTAFSARDGFVPRSWGAKDVAASYRTTLQPPGKEEKVGLAVPFSADTMEGEAEDDCDDMWSDTQELMKISRQVSCPILTVYKANT